MEKSVTEQATNSEFLLRLHRLLLSDLEGVQLSTGKILDSIEEEAAQKREDYLVLLEVFISFGIHLHIVCEIINNV